MAKTAMIRARTEPRIKKQAELVLDHLGITPTQIINMLYKKIIMENGLPFDVKIPNKTTLKAMEDVEKNRNLRKFKNSEEFLRDLKK